MQRASTFFGLGNGDTKSPQSSPLPTSHNTTTTTTNTRQSSTSSQLSHLVNLVAAYKDEKEALVDELSVKSQTVTSLANTLYLTQTELATRVKEIQERKEQLENFSKELVQQRELATGAAPKFVAQERRLAELEDDLAQAQIAATAPLKVEIESLKQQRLDDAEAQKAWKEKVKSALKDGKLREQLLVEERNALKAELEEQGKKVAAMNFQLETAGLRKAKVRADGGTQTDISSLSGAADGKNAAAGFVDTTTNLSGPASLRAAKASSARRSVVSIEEPSNNINQEPGSESPSLYGSFRGIPSSATGGLSSPPHSSMGISSCGGQLSSTTTTALEESIGAALFAHVFTKSGVSAQWLLNPFECGPFDLSTLKHLLLSSSSLSDIRHQNGYSSAPNGLVDDLPSSTPQTTVHQARVRRGSLIRPSNAAIAPSGAGLRRRSLILHGDAAAGTPDAAGARRTASRLRSGSGGSAAGVGGTGGDRLGFLGSGNHIPHYFPQGVSRTLSLCATERQRKMLQGGILASVASGQLQDDYRTVYSQYQQYIKDATAFFENVREWVAAGKLAAGDGSMSSDLVDKMGAILPRPPPEPSSTSSSNTNYNTTAGTSEGFSVPIPENQGSTLLAVVQGRTSGDTVQAGSFAGASRSVRQRSISYADGGTAALMGGGSGDGVLNDTFMSASIVGSPGMRGAMALPEVDSVLRNFTQRQQLQQQDISPPSGTTPFVAVVRYNTSTSGGSTTTDAKQTDDENPWTIDTKAQITTNMTVSELLAVSCTKFNNRHELSLDPSCMCFKVFHQPTQRFVTLSSSRRLHSYSYLLKVAGALPRANIQSTGGTALPPPFNLSASFARPASPAPTSSPTGGGIGAAANTLTLHLQPRDVQREAVHEYLNSCV